MMKELKKLWLLPLLLVGQTASVHAQEVRSTDTAMKLKPAVNTPIVKKPVVKKPKPITSEISGGFRLNTDGWGIFVDKGWVKSEEKERDYFYNTQLLQIEFGEKKHPKEIKRSNNIGSGADKAKPFIFGKINNFYALKFGYGGRKMIAGKPEQGNVSIHWVYLGGLSLGLQKPYYLIVQPNGESARTIKYSDTTAEIFLTRNYIIGGAGLSQGLGEVQIIPGAHLKTGFHFDFAASKFTKMAVEVGANAEFYTKDIELMALQKATPYLFNFYAAVQFGKRKQ